MNDPGQGSATESDTIGSTAGNFRVDESGAATYSIPIATAAGTAGVAPEISLNYSSGTGNNIAGTGWSIGGLSAISRCRQTYDQDRFVSKLSFASSDRFCLDGQRLLLTSLHNYGAAGSAYRAEIDNGVIVTVVGNTSGEPDYFEVARKDGSTSYYGKAPGSSDISGKLGDGGGRTLTWAIRRFQDSAGNSIWFEYDTSSGAQRISEVKWAYGASADATSGYGARLKFNYEARNDKKSGYFDGALFQNDKRLTSIVSYNSGEVIREYILRYNEGIDPVFQNVSRLTSIQECVQSTCLPKTTFGWRVPAISPSLGIVANFSMGGSNLGEFKPADINGDGRMDLVWREGSSALKYAFYNGSAFALQQFSNGSTSLSLATNSSKLTPVDYNLDGRQDIAYFDYSAGRWKVLLSEPHGDGDWRLSSSAITTPIYNPNALFADFDSNGTTDVIYKGNGVDARLFFRRLERDSGESDTSSHRYAYSAEVQIADTSPHFYGSVAAAAPDFDGDGQTDIVELGSDYVCDPQCGFVIKWRALMSSNFSANPPAITVYYSFPLASTTEEVKVVDINADGLSDVFYAVTSSAGDILRYRLEINRGDGSFTGRDVSNSSLLEDGASPQLVDWNMDGHPDLLWKDNSGSGSIRVRYWNPSADHFDSETTVTSVVTNSAVETAFFLDVNGDAVPDLATINAGGTVGALIVRTRKEGSATSYVGINRIESITNGLGAKTKISYEPLSYSNHYERLQVTSSPGTATFCEDLGHPGEEICYDQPIQVANEADFYEQINGDWDYPTNWQYLKKSSPIIEMSGPLYVVTEVIGDAPAAGATPGSVNVNGTSSISYHYFEAKIQAAGRGFLGFQRLRTVDNQSGVETTTRYRQDWPFIGKPIGTDVRSSAGHKLSTTSTDWSIKEWDSNTKQAAADFGTAALGPLHVVQTENEDTQYDLTSNGTAQGSLLSKIETINQYDSEGNATSIVVTTRKANDQVIKSTQIVNTYDSAYFELWEGRLSTTAVTTTREGEPAPLLRSSSFDYYQAAPHRGLLWKETVEPSSSYTLVTEHSYDPRGNRIKSRTTGGSTTRCDATTSSFDTRYRYVDTERDCLGRTVSVVTARNKFGAPTTIEKYVDTNDSVTTQVSYSVLGREYYRYTADGSAESKYLSASLANCPAGTAFEAVTSSATGAATEECYDVLGRVTRSMTLGFDGQWDAQDTEYDQFGRVKRKSEPFDLVSGSQMAPHWTTFTYDLLGRVTRTDLPDTSWGTTAYAGLTAVHTNVAGQTRTELNNVLGELTQVTDNLGGTTAYTYDHQGNLTTVTDNANNVTVMEYDLLGRKKLMEDPDKGNWSYEYTHFGELRLQTNANDQTSTMTYDGLGRIKTRVDKLANGTTESSAVWTYDTAAFGLGQLASMQDTQSGYMRAVIYDEFGRISEVVTNFSGGIYYERSTYDQFGRPYQVFDAAGDGSYTDHAVVHQYNSRGHLESIGDAVLLDGEPQTIYRRITSMNARGQVTAEQIGIDNSASSPAPSVTTTYVFDAATGRLRFVDGMNAAGLDVQDLDYIWDSLGNLSDRKEFSGSKSLQETFAYDGLNRLESQTVAGQASVTVTYDLQHLGNIKSKSDVGTYSYNSSRPHAVTAAGSASYTYDANGNNIGGDGRTIKYRTFDKPWEISKGGHKTTFAYDPDRARYLRIDDGGGVTTTRYIGNVEIINLPNGTQQRKRYIAGVAVETRTLSGGVETAKATRYLHKDHLGSLDVITDESGAVVQEFSFDAWGQRRNATNWTALTQTALTTFDHSRTTRGFTGHEMLDEVGIIHMNGRIYDPKLGRFLQADPIVQDSTNSQSLNRYSYVWNNPLNATDPSGYFIFTLAAIAAVAGGTVATVQAVVAVFAFAGFADTLLAGGNLKDALLAGISSAAFAALGAQLGEFSFGFNPETVGRVAAFGMVGGVTSVLQGGEFGHGFRSAGISTVTGGIAGRLTRGMHPVKQAVAAAVAGGTASKLTGGKFANGATTAGFAYAFGSLASNAAQNSRGEWMFPEGGSTDINDYVGEGGTISVTTSGILESRDAFQELLNTDGVPGYFNPSHGPVADVIESFNQKFFGWAGDPLAAGFARGLVGANFPLTITAHSQGTLTVANAVRYYGLSADGSTFIMKSPALTYFGASSIIQGAGGTIVWQQPYRDIANIYAPTMNPVKWISGFSDVFCGACVHRANGLH